MSEYFGTGPLWTWVKIDDWCDPSSAGTLTHVKTIETCVESAFATICVQFAIAGCFLLFWWGWLGRVALHQVTWTKKLNNKLKVGISSLSETKSEPKSFTFTFPFYSDPLNSARVCIQTAVTAAVLPKMCVWVGVGRLSQWPTKFVNNPRQNSWPSAPKTWSFAGLPSLSKKFSAPHLEPKIP
jgi:hypothetical protein